MENSISVSGLTKSYGERRVVDDLSFVVKEREIFGLLGPNGAGKTTTLEVVAGIRKPSSGGVLIRGHEPTRDRKYIVNTVAMQQQESSVFQFLTVSELIYLQASFYDQPRPPEEVIELAGLSEHKNQRYARLSGGQKRRLAFGLAVVGNTEILILDEPAAGLDPSARIDLQDSIRYLQSVGKTVLYTTHHLEEATDLCDRVAIIAAGALQTVGSPQSLIDQFSSAATVDFRLKNTADIDEAAAWCDSLPHINDYTMTRGGSVSLSTDNSDEFLKTLHKAPFSFQNLKIRGGSLNDVYTSLVKGK